MNFQEYKKVSRQRMTEAQKKEYDRFDLWFEIKEFFYNLKIKIRLFFFKLF